MQELPFANETFDLATAFETIYFWSDIDQSFSQIYRVLKKVEFLWFVMSQMAKMTKIKMDRDYKRNENLYFQRD